MRGFVVVLILSLFDYLSLGGGKHALAFKAFLIFCSCRAIKPLPVFAVSRSAMMHNSRQPIGCVRAADFLHLLSCFLRTCAADPVAAAACQSPVLLLDVTQADMGRAGVDLAGLTPRDSP